MLSDPQQKNYPEFSECIVRNPKGAEYKSLIKFLRHYQRSLITESKYSHYAHHHAGLPVY